MAASGACLRIHLVVGIVGVPGFAIGGLFAPDAIGELRVRFARRSNRVEFGHERFER
jgi:hypothetical protein